MRISLSKIELDPVEQPAAFKRSFAGKYNFVAEIGSGGMGIIYKAKQPLLDRFYAIKMLNVHKASQQTLARFHQEAKAASALNHPNVISVHDFGFTDNDEPYMVMDFVDGVSLATLIQSSGFIRYQEALGIFIQIADGMNHAHALGVLHRDLKPGNVMLTNAESMAAEVKIVDFGIAKINKAEENCSLTQTGDVFGSPLYMSPEQASGKKVDARSDIYSLGCLMYEVLTGKPPLKADTIIQTMFLQLNEKPLPMKQASQWIAIPESLEYVVSRCLEKDPDRRYQTMFELKKDLVKVAGERLIIDRSVAVRERIRKDASKTVPKINWMQLVVVLTALLAAAFTVFERFEMIATAERREAQAQTIEQKFTNDLQTIEDKPLSGIDGEMFAIQEIAEGNSIVNFPPMSADDAALIYMQGSPKIVALTMRSNTITPDGFTHLKFPNLERLDLQETEVSPQLLTALANLPKLNTLSLSKTHLDASALAQISKMKTLKSLNLNHSDIGDEDCRILAQMNGLEQLKIGQNPRLTDKGVAYLKSLKNLKLLDLNKTSVTDKCVVPLKSLSKLIDLRLYESGISNEACKALAKMSLQKLYLSDTNIGAPSILPLSKMNSLVYLEIDRNPGIPLAMQAYLADELARRGTVVKIDHGSTGETQPPAKSKYRLEV